VVDGGHTRKAALEMEISRTLGSQAVLLYSLTAIIGDCLRVKPYQERQPPRIQILLARAWRRDVPASPRVILNEPPYNDSIIVSRTCLDHLRRK